MRKDLVIIDSYPSTDISKEVLKECILNLKDTFDIALSTHYPVSEDIQSLVDYYIFDSFNDIIERDDNYKVWFGTSTFYLQITHKKNYAYSAYSCILNAASLLNKKYDYFYHINGDMLIHHTDIDKLLQLKDTTLKNNKKCLFFKEFDASSGEILPKAGVVNTKLFFSDTKFFVENICTVNSKDEFIQYSQTLSMPYVPYLLESFYADRIDKCFLNDAHFVTEPMEEYFKHSELDVINSFNGVPQRRRNYQVYLVKEKHSNKIFFVYITPTIHTDRPHIDVKANDEHFVVENTWHSLYRELLVNEDYIKLEVDGASHIYKTKDIIEDTESYIELH